MNKREKVYFREMLASDEYNDTQDSNDFTSAWETIANKSLAFLRTEEE